MCMRASEASELRKFWYFYILKLLFLSIFCRYIRCFVGTNDMLVGLHVPKNFSMYRKISKCTDKSPKRHYWGGGGAIVPLPPPPLATLMVCTYVRTYVCMYVCTCMYVCMHGVYLYECLHTSVLGRGMLELCEVMNATVLNPSGKNF